MTIQEDRNFARRYISKGNLMRPNQLRFSRNESYNHKRAKFEVCVQLMEKEMEFYVEAVFHNGTRADVFCLDNLTVIECLETETLEECANKTARYPDGIHIEVARMVNDKLEWIVRK